MTATTAPIGKKSARGPYLAAIIMGLVLGFFVAELLSRHRLPYEKKLQQEFIYKAVKIRNHTHTNENTTMADKLYGEVRVLCWIMTYPKNHELKARHVKETWGKRCNKLLFMSSAKDAELGTIALPVGEGRDNLWGKTKEAFKYIYQHHMDDADWFLKADDDTYVIVENLRYMLYPYSPETPIYFGCKFKPHVKQGYMSGGAGYVLSKEAVRRFVTKAMPQPSLCYNNNDGSEDLEIGKCLENVNVFAGDSRDSHDLEKFFPFPLNYEINTAYIPSWYWKYNFYKNNKTNSDCCSDDMISFHYITPKEMQTLDFFIYHLHPYGIVRMSKPLPNKLTIEQAVPAKMISSNATLAPINVV